MIQLQVAEMLEMASGHENQMAPISDVVDVLCSTGDSFGLDGSDC